MLKLLLTLFLDEHACAMLLRMVRWPNGIYCPRCNSGRINKNGKCKLIFQRYKRKECSRTFNDKTGTVFHYSHRKLSEWFTAICLFRIVSWLGCPISSISVQLRIQCRIRYHMVGAITGRIASAEEAKLDGEVEIDGLYTHAGMKGRSCREMLTHSRP